MDTDYAAAAAAAVDASNDASRNLAAARDALRAHEIALDAAAPARAVAAGKPIAEAAAVHARLSSELNFLKEAVSFAEEAERAARQAHTHAAAELHRPAFNAARARRLDAAMAADAARAALAAAEAEHAAATREIQRAHEKHLARPFDGSLLFSTAINEAAERALWAEVPNV